MHGKVPHCTIISKYDSCGHWMAVSMVHLPVSLLFVKANKNHMEILSIFTLQIFFSVILISKDKIQLLDTTSVITVFVMLLETKGMVISQINIYLYTYVY